MRFGKKLLAAIERGEWVRRRNWHEGFKMRKGDEGFFVDEMGYAVAVPVDAAAVLATDWVIVRKKSKAPNAPVADDPRYEPVETMPVVGDKVAHPNDGGRHPSLTVEKILGAGDAHRWRVEAGGSACSLNSNGYGWRILKRRDVFTDPKPGDVIGRANVTLEVKFADAEAVLFRSNRGNFNAVSRETWAACAAVSWTVQKLGA